MPDEATIKRWIAKYGAFVIVAILGGIAREAKDRMDGRPFSILDFLARLMIAAFAGLLVIFLATDIGMSPQMIGAIAGVAGYSGVESIECAKRIVKGRTGQ